MSRYLREPLAHFLLLGAVLFALSPYVKNDAASGDDRIVVSSDRIDHLAALFARTWQRPPEREELEGLIDDYVREEAAYREGMAMGLDADDTIIRRRIRQKLDFITEDLAGQLEPTEEDLRGYLATHSEAFRIQPRLTIQQVYFSPEKRGDRIEDDVRTIIDALNEDSSIEVGEVGDRFPLDRSYTAVPLRTIANIFGMQFAQAVDELEPGTWCGPIPSGYGVHAVFVEERLDGRLPELDEVRNDVEREWENDRRRATTEQFYRDLLKKYDVMIEWPQDNISDTAP